MSEAAAIQYPPIVGNGDRGEDEHRFIFKAFIIDAMSAAKVAVLVTERFRPTSAAAITGYADRQCWKKAATAGSNVKLMYPSSQPHQPGKKMRVRKPGPRARRLIDLDVVDLETSRIIERGCRFPVGKSPAFAMSEQLFCGEVQKPDSPYCPKCSGLAYPGNAKKA